MDKVYNPPTPIKDIFEKLSAGHEIVTEGSDAPSAPQSVRLVYNIIHQIDLFDTTFH